MKQAASATPGGGIQFDTEPQAGDWLDVETTGTDGSGYGMHLTAAATARVDSDTGIELAVGAGGNSIYATAPDFLFNGTFSGTDDFAVNVGGSVLLNSGTASLGLQAGNVVLGSSNDPVSIFSNTATIHLTASLGDIIIDPGTGTLFLGPSGAPFLMIVPDGGGSWNYHVKTGKTWISDL